MFISCCQNQGLNAINVMCVAQTPLKCLFKAKTMGAGGGGGGDTRSEKLDT